MGQKVVATKNRRQNQEHTNMIKRFLVPAAALLIWALSLVTPMQPAQAQPMNCMQYIHTSFMCITNMTPYPIVGVTANPNMGWTPTQWIPIPGGMILPGHTGVVNFNVGWGNACWQYVFVHTANNLVHSFRTNVCTGYNLNIVRW